jgi:hypothetical protein
VVSLPRLAFVLMLALPAGELVAHHSFAAFDVTQPQYLSGTVKELQWGNPHIWLQLLVTNKSGAVEEWSLEGFSPNVLKRRGWKRDILHAGEKVRTEIRPRRDGSNGGLLVAVTREDGTLLISYDQFGPR